MKKNLVKFISTISFAFLLASCTTDGPVSFSWADSSFTPIIGSRTNNEVHDYDSLIVNPVEGLREDFCMGVDASMVAKVEESGGVYYNEAGQEQDVFQIMANDGVNFFRVRVWNNPYDSNGNGYGGGDCDVETAIAMSKRAVAAGMKVMVDLHYSDFWADPNQQVIPDGWESLTADNLATEVQTYTREVLNQFKNEGVKVDAVQIGNEINNGMMWPTGQINWNFTNQSFKVLAKLIKAGIAGAKQAVPSVYTVLHLANGGNDDEFEAFFDQMVTNEVDYDIIGASYYPYYHGTLEALQTNLDNLATKYAKPVIIAEMSYGYTVAETNYAANIYDTSMEEAGGYLTSIQGQATAIRDVIQTLASVPNDLGLGIFYWEPAWLPVDGAGWCTIEGSNRSDDDSLEPITSDGYSTWANQGLFSYTGKALPSLSVFKQVREDNEVVTEAATGIRSESIDVTINIAVGETLPTTYKANTNLDAIREMPVVWDATDLALLANPGTYVIDGIVDGNYPVTANVVAMENYVLDPGFEIQGETDTVVSPWIIESQTPTDKTVVRLNRKASDVRSGKANINWYYASTGFTLKVKQNISNLAAGTYTLSTYCMAVAQSEKVHNELYVYIKYNNGTTLTYDLADKIMGWGDKNTYYVKAEINNIEITSDTAEIGFYVDAVAAAWGHIDDWALFRTN